MSETRMTPSTERTRLPSMSTFRNIVRYVLTAPMFLGYLWPLVMCAIYAAHDLRFTDNAVLVATWRPWVVKFWRYSTTLARGMVMSPPERLKETTPAHEQVHVRQFEDATILSLVIGALWALSLMDGWASLGVFFGVWASGSLWLIPGYLGTVLRGGHVYRDAEIERSGYGQTDDRQSGGPWLDDHLSREREW